VGGYRFPRADGSCDLILATSVFTHLLAGELRHYLGEVSRLLAPGGVAYTSFFLYQSADEAAAGMARHGIRFPCRRARYAVNREDFPANAVAYEEAYVRELAAEFGLAVLEPAHYGVQDLVLLTRVSDGELRAELGAGWHELEDERWRWTERVFSAQVWRPQAAGTMRLRFLFTVPEGLAPVRLAVWADGVVLEVGVFGGSGEQVYEGSFALDSAGETVRLEFALDRALGLFGEDRRELGVQVAFRPGPGAPERDLLPIVVTDCGG
jgi:SAM-dependent methyltransferase